MGDGGGFTLWFAVLGLSLKCARKSHTPEPYPTLCDQEWKRLITEQCAYQYLIFDQRRKYL